MVKLKLLSITIIYFLIIQINCAGPEKREEQLREISPSLSTKKYSTAEVSFIKSQVDRISDKELRENILALQNLGTRYAPSQGNKRAAVYIKAAFESYGLKEVRFDEFFYYNELTGFFDSTSNVIASKKGVKKPEKIVLIGAHYDTICRLAADGKVSALDKENPAPGADDNGTGIAGVLAAARVLSPFDFDCTIRFCAFSAEEEGIHGSAYYAAECAKRNENIAAVINLDMIGNADQEPEDIDIFSNKKSTWLLDKVVNIASIYAPGLLIYRIVNDTYDGSDHGPFWNNGYPAVCFMEDYYPSSKFYHTPRDTIETVNMLFALKCVKLAVAAVAELAGIHIDEKSQVPHPAFAGKASWEAADWQKGSGKKLLFTLSPSLNQADIIDISFSHIHSKKTMLLGAIVAETWARPCYYPVAVTQSTSQKFLYVSMIRVRNPGKESDEGIVKIIDPKRAEVLRSFKVGRFPMSGCLSADGARFYLPYWGERYIDVFDTASLKQIDRIPVPVPLSKLAIDNKERVAVAISPETNSILIINLRDKKIEKVFDKVTIPKDIVVMNNHFALACSYDKGKMYQIDFEQNKITAEIATEPRPIHLKISAQKDLLISIHQLSGKINLFRIEQDNEKLSIEKTKELNFGGVITDGTFGADHNIAYFVNSDQCRLCGVELDSGKIFWGMRTGGVTAREDVELIAFIY